MTVAVVLMMQKAMLMPVTGAMVDAMMMATNEGEVTTMDARASEGTKIETQNNDCNNKKRLTGGGEKEYMCL